MDVGVVTYNANLELLKESYSLIRDSVDHYIIFDNGSLNQEQLYIMFQDDAKVVIDRSKTNVGIACALNGIMRQSQSLGGEWVMLLDHDSMPSRFLINSIASLTQVVEGEVAIICPSILSIHGKAFANLEQGKNTRIVQGMQVCSVNRCITSGSCLSIAAYEYLGPFDENLFIDEVDYEYCYRLIRLRKTILRINNISLLHEVLPDSGMKQIRFMSRTVQVGDLSIPRVYYRVRNTRYLTLKYAGYARPRFLAAKLIVKSVLFEEDKIKRISAVIKGYRAGKFL